MHVHALFGGVRGVGRPIIIKKRMVSIKFSLFVWGGGRRPQNHWKYVDFHTFSWFVWWNGGRWRPRIIENAMFSMHRNGLLGEVGGEGGPRIIESILIYTFSWFVRRGAGHGRPKKH